MGGCLNLSTSSLDDDRVSLCSGMILKMNETKTHHCRHCHQLIGTCLTIVNTPLTFSSSPIYCHIHIVAVECCDGSSSNGTRHSANA